MAGEILNADEACDFLKVGRATLYRHVKNGSIPSFRIGKVLRFHKETLMNWISEKVQEDSKSKLAKR